MHKLFNPFTKSRKEDGFTLVELLIVIVVIAILAAIATVAFNGIQRRAIIATLDHAISETTNRIKVDKVTRGSYALSLSDIQNSTSSNDSGVSYQYTSDGTEYCLTATLKNVARYTSSTNPSVSDGVCAGHDEPVSGPITDPVVHTQTGSFNANQPPYGINFSISIGYALQPTDYVFILFNTQHQSGVTLQNNGTPIPRIYSMNMGNSGYQWHQAFSVSGLNGPTTIAGNACWTVSCSYNNVNVSGAYVVYVMRGLGSSPTMTTTTTPYGVQPAFNEVVAPAAQTLPARKVAIFSNVYYGNNQPGEGDQSSPSLSWVSDSTSPPFHLGTAIAARHTFTTTSTSVQYQNTMPSTGTRYHGSVLFTFN